MSVVSGEYGSNGRSSLYYISHCVNCGAPLLLLLWPSLLFHLSFALLSSFFFGAAVRIIIIVMRRSMRCRHRHHQCCEHEYLPMRRPGYDATKTACATTATTTTMATATATDAREMRIRKRNNATNGEGIAGRAFAGTINSQECFENVVNAPSVLTG